MGVSYYVVATSLIGLVGDYLFDDRKQQDRVSTSRLAEELAPLYLSAQTQALQERLEAAAAELGARLMVLDMSGKKIKGLYAAGNCLGGRYGLGYSTPCAGNSIGMAVTHGRLAGQFISEE